jgi:hypothetical protein
VARRLLPATRTEVTLARFSMLSRFIMDAILARQRITSDERANLRIVFPQANCLTAKRIRLSIA